MIEFHEWDGESYCVEEGCPNPAIAERLVGVVDHDVDGDGFCWLVELVCGDHADDQEGGAL